MTHSLLSETEHQQEIDSKNKEQAPSAFPLILYIQLLRRRAQSLHPSSPSGWRRRIRRASQQQSGADLSDTLAEYSWCLFGDFHVNASVEHQGWGGEACSCVYWKVSVSGANPKGQSSKRIKHLNPFSYFCGKDLQPTAECWIFHHCFLKDYNI